MNRMTQGSRPDLRRAPSVKAALHLAFYRSAPKGAEHLFMNNKNEKKVFDE
jgi:hypothetical protein